MGSIDVIEIGNFDISKQTNYEYSMSCGCDYCECSCDTDTFLPEDK